MLIYFFAMYYLGGDKYGGSLPRKNGKRTNLAGKKANTTFNSHANDVSSNHSNNALHSAFDAVGLFSGWGAAQAARFLSKVLCNKIGAILYITSKPHLIIHKLPIV